VLVAEMGRFKGEDGDRMHVFPLVNVTKSGIRIRVWLVRVACLLDFEDRSSCPAFCDEAGYQLESKDVEKVFHPILHSIQRNVNFPDLIPQGLDVTVHYRCARSFRRGAENMALEEGLEDRVIQFVHRWGKFERSRGSQPGFNMMEHYAEGASTLYMQQLSFSANL